MYRIRYSSKEEFCIEKTLTNQSLIIRYSDAEYRPLFDTEANHYKASELGMEGSETYFATILTDDCIRYNRLSLGRKRLIVHHDQKMNYLPYLLSYAFEDCSHSDQHFYFPFFQPMHNKEGFSIMLSFVQFGFHPELCIKRMNRNLQSGEAVEIYDKVTRESYVVASDSFLWRKNIHPDLSYTTRDVLYDLFCKFAAEYEAKNLKSISVKMKTYRVEDLKRLTYLGPFQLLSLTVESKNMQPHYYAWVLFMFALPPRLQTMCSNFIHDYRKEMHRRMNSST